MTAEAKGVGRVWRGMTIKRAPAGSDNAARNRVALKAMSVLERECGITLDEFEAYHRAQRERVIARAQEQS